MRSALHSLHAPLIVSDLSSLVLPLLYLRRFALPKPVSASCSLVVWLDTAHTKAHFCIARNKRRGVEGELRYRRIEMWTVEMWTVLVLAYLETKCYS